MFQNFGNELSDADLLFTLQDNNVVRILALLKERQLACDHPCLVKSRIDYEQCSKIFKRSYVSSKMKAIIDILNSIVNKHAFTESNNNIESSTIESAPEKVLVFSQFTMMLDLLQPLLNSNGIQFRRLDGKMNRKARDEAVEDFKRNPEVITPLLYCSRNLNCLKDFDTNPDFNISPANTQNHFLFFR